MESMLIQEWFDRLGYTAKHGALHTQGEHVPYTHPYALEIKGLLKPGGAIQAQAVFDVEGVPTVVFFGKSNPLSSSELDEVRKRIWNQNLATVVITLKETEAIALPVRKLRKSEQRLSFHEARPDGPFSAMDVATANISRRLPKWFDVKARVDSKLLTNLSVTVSKLTSEGFSGVLTESNRKRLAELLMGQVLFISYLEHREIVGETYRERRSVSSLHKLVALMSRDGVQTLVDQLRKDFNGDFLGDDSHTPWTALADEGFGVLDLFLSQTDMETGQGDFWNYDFSYIPVELLSGLYEKFLQPEQQAKDGAYYTPRNLAMLAIDQAFMASPDPLVDTIFDGACGSGILLTTAYRRLIALSEARQGRQIGFAERGALLVSRIFGADINFMACRVTAFSLYLSLLEGLDPADILEAQERDGTKLPPLQDSNLAHGEMHGDFFKNSHKFYGRKFSLIISNPPWAEPEGAARTSADDWAQSVKAPVARRQIAGAYTLRALEFLSEEGRACLILPIAQFLAASASNTAFVKHTLRCYRPTRLINFGDLQGLLFPTAEHTCHIFLGESRSSGLAGYIPFGETFDYLVPKADMSLALGRLTMQSADRHSLQTQTVAEDPQLLVTMMWGDKNDLALWTRLTMRGSLADFWRGPRESRRWVNRKGVHLRDNSREAVSSDKLHKMPFIPITSLRTGSPVLHPHLLIKWPVDQATVVGLNETLLSVFDGPRVIFPDGFSRGEQNIRAVYYDGPASFTVSIGVISGPKEDEALLQFAAIYLRSTLAQYFLMMRGWKMLCERNGAHLIDIEAFPFFPPENAPKPEIAHKALLEIQARMQELKVLPDLEQAPRYRELRGELDKLIFAYFDLGLQEQRLIYETVRILMPSIRPRSFKSLDTPAQHKACPEDIEIYADILGDALTSWRVKTHGCGRFNINVIASDARREGPCGIVCITYDEQITDQPTISTQINDELVLATLGELQDAGLRTIPSGDFLTLVPDIHIWIEGALYLVRPLAKRNWTMRQALRDAEHLVRNVQQQSSEGDKA